MYLCIVSILPTLVKFVVCYTPISAPDNFTLVLILSHIPTTCLLFKVSTTLMFSYGMVNLFCVYNVNLYGYKKITRCFVFRFSGFQQHILKMAMEPSVPGSIFTEGGPD